jgi:hypothetical protein
MGSATTPTVVSIATMPTSMTDAEATRLGLKSYSHGTTYKDGIAPTVTAAVGSFSVLLANFIPYQIQSGAWRLRFNVTGTFSGTSASTIARVNIVGVLFSAVTAQNISVQINGISLAGGRVDANNNNLRGDLLSSQTYDTLAQYSGDVLLDSKPTWAY